MIEDLCYKNAVVHNLDLESFMNINGVSDFKGRMQRFDYARDVAVKMR